MCPTTCAKPPGELRADPGVDPPLASARQAGLCHHPALCPTSTPGLLEAVQRLRAEFPDTLQTHLSENREEIAGLNSCGLSMRAIWMSIITISSPANAASSLTGSISMMPSGSACMTPGPQSPSARRRICFSAAGCSACPPAGHQCGWASAATSEPGPPSACCGRWARPQGRTTAELSPARQRGLYHATLGGRAPCGWRRNWQFPAGQRGGFCGD